VSSLPQDSNCAENVRRCLTQFDVFMAYAWGPDSQGRPNNVRAAEFCRRLQLAEFKVWLDTEQVGPSKSGVSWIGGTPSVIMSAGYEGGSRYCLSPYGTAYRRALRTTRTRNNYPNA
jgi:hypothetical protein